MGIGNTASAALLTHRLLPAPLKACIAYESRVESASDGLADHLEAHRDLDGLLGVARGRQSATASPA